ncbi:uncharacterized protein LOC125162073 [Prionailurus viverrinus]|uniref:uncharacterized protein LOC125162073 n=1 Tax=Prionailurus viverrinus TaxID=61388 RepID=UPI001FF5F28B|nr:uncharacterized protein LOC125162073 [Prionailurus viverrinus]
MPPEDLQAKVPSGAEKPPASRGAGLAGQAGYRFLRKPRGQQTVRGGTWQRGPRPHPSSAVTLEKCLRPTPSPPRGPSPFQRLPAGLRPPRTFQKVLENLGKSQADEGEWTLARLGNPYCVPNRGGPHIDAPTPVSTTLALAAQGDTELRRGCDLRARQEWPPGRLTLSPPLPGEGFAGAAGTPTRREQGQRVRCKRAPARGPEAPALPPCPCDSASLLGAPLSFHGLRSGRRRLRGLLSGKEAPARLQARRLNSGQRGLPFNRQFDPTPDVVLLSV